MILLNMNNVNDLKPYIKTRRPLWHTAEAIRNGHITELRNIYIVYRNGKGLFTQPFSITFMASYF